VSDAPHLIVDVELEGAVVAYAIRCPTEAEELRLLADLELRPDLLGEIAVALDDFLLDTREEAP
jgi:hypothetical protein